MQNLTVRAALLFVVMVMVPSVGNADCVGKSSSTATVMKDDLTGYRQDQGKRIDFEWKSMAYKDAKSDGVWQVENVVCNNGDRSLLVSWKKADLENQIPMAKGSNIRNGYSVFESDLTVDNDAPLRFDYRGDTARASIYASSDQSGRIADKSGPTTTYSELELQLKQESGDVRTFGVYVKSYMDGYEGHIVVSQTGEAPFAVRAALSTKLNYELEAKEGISFLRLPMSDLTQTAGDGARFAVFDRSAPSVSSYKVGSDARLTLGRIALVDGSGKPLAFGIFSYFGHQALQ